MDNKFKICCFMGHRPENLTIKEERAKFLLRKEIKQAIADGYKTFISGMARGVDIWAAEIVLETKRYYPDIKLICAQPYEYFSKDQSWEWNVRYKKITCQASETVTVSCKQNKDCFIIRNKWMIDHSNRLIALYDGSKGETQNTIQYALSKGRDIKLIDPKEI